MAYHYSNPLSPTSSLRTISAAPSVDDLSSRLSHNLYIHEAARIETAVQGTEHEKGRGARWSALRPLPATLCERVKTGLRAVRGVAGPQARSDEEKHLPIPNDRPEAAFSALGGGACLFLAQMPPDAPPPTIVWQQQGQGLGVTWGQWPCHAFTHCVTVLTECNARTLYELDEAPLPPVWECALDAVAHLWLIVPPRGTHERSILSDAQMRSALEFVNVAQADEGGAGPILLACAEGNEVDVAALAVLLLARRSRSVVHERVPDRRFRQRSERALEPMYQAARQLDDDPGVSLIWKGLLGWQDVERLQAVL